MRVATAARGLKKVCEGRGGGSEGSALMCIVLLILLDGILKETEQRLPGVEIKAIQGNVGLYGDPVIILGEDGALDFILAELRKVELGQAFISSRPTSPYLQSSGRPSRRSRRSGSSGRLSSRTRSPSPKSSTRRNWPARPKLRLPTHPRRPRRQGSGAAPGRGG